MTCLSLLKTWIFFFILYILCYTACFLSWFVIDSIKTWIFCLYFLCHLSVPLHFWIFLSCPWLIQELLYLFTSPTTSNYVYFHSLITVVTFLIQHFNLSGLQYSIISSNSLFFFFSWYCLPFLKTNVSHIYKIYNRYWILHCNIQLYQHDF